MFNLPDPVHWTYTAMKLGRGYFSVLLYTKNLGESIFGEGIDKLGDRRMSLFKNLLAGISLIGLSGSLITNMVKAEEKSTALALLLLVLVWLCTWAASCEGSAIISHYSSVAVKLKVENLVAYLDKAEQLSICDSLIHCTPIATGSSQLLIITISLSMLAWTNHLMRIHPVFVVLITLYIAACWFYGFRQHRSRHIKALEALRDKTTNSRYLHQIQIQEMP